MNLDLGDALHTFFAESRALLQDMEEALLRLEGAPDDMEAVNAVFRAAHTIKGSSGLFALDDIVAFTHKAENVLDRLRNGELALKGDLIGLFLACRDHIERLIDFTATSTEIDSETRAHGDKLASQLGKLMSGAAADLPAGKAALTGSLDLGKGGDDTWHISLRFSQGVLRNGMDPLSFLRYLATVGEVVHLITLADTLPPAHGMDPECCYLGFEIRLRSGADKASIEGVFEFVRDDCSLYILPPGSRVLDYLALIEALPENNIRLGEILVACGALTARELEESLATQNREAAAASSEAGSASGAHRPLGEIIVEQQMLQPEVVDAALQKQKDARHKQSQETRFVRVHADKLDGLINLVGELVIAGAGVGLMASRYKDGTLIESVSGMSRLVEEIRDGAMRLRMVEIGETFNRFRRVVRDMSKELGKDIELEIGGAETELDKTVVEKIGDPLTHLVRNAMDHGIEVADTRLALGKSAQGKLRLNAFHEAGGIVIEVSDDGGGLNRERILAKARDKGLIQDGDNPADRDVWNLIFEPGFSTAEQVSNLSGRGVGMDVVRRNIEALRGTVEIESRAGQGSTFRIRLPLTLAIIDGFLMGVADSHYVVPLDMVLECVEMNTPSDSGEGSDYLNLRGEVLPLLRLKGEFQAVIKPLGKLFEQIRGISGSTILGSGEVALVLDVPTLLDEAARVGSSGVTV